MVRTLAARLRVAATTDPSSGPVAGTGLALLDPGTEIYVDITVTDFGGNQVIGAATFIQD